jgi:DNA-directed RNA polymerase specialized sigma24 family protein
MPRSTPEIDELTLARARRGDDAACRAVFRHYQRAVYCLAWRMLGGRANPALVEDLTQETFLRVFKSLAGFASDGTARLSTWILTIATRLALNEQRHATAAMSGLQRVTVVRDGRDVSLLPDRSPHSKNGFEAPNPGIHLAGPHVTAAKASQYWIRTPRVGCG